MPRLPIAKLQFVSLDHHDADAVAVSFRPRGSFSYRAGQHGLWIVPGGGLMPFSIASAPEEELVTLGTSLESGSRFKRALAALTADSTVRFIGPLSRFTLDEAAPSVVMLAQGMGITPFRSMLRHAAMSGREARTTLVHVGARHPFRADTEAAATEARYPASREEFGRELEAAVLRQPQATFMVSGKPAFVTSAVAELKARSVDPSRIMRDKFYGYPKHRE